MVTKKILLNNFDEAMRLFGSKDENLRSIETALGVQIFSRQSPSRGDFVISVRGASGKVEEAVRRIEDARRLGKFEPRRTSVETTGGVSGEVVIVNHAGKAVKARTIRQQIYADAIEEYDVVVAIGPAGTGKTYLAVACALKFLQTGRISKIVLTRPVVEAGEKLGFLPGDFREKVEPYLKPLYDSFYSIIGSDRFRALRDDDVIEIIPLAYMRGRTVEDAFIILDEAQNTTSSQMLMFLTRLGERAKAVVTGDVTQIDLENKEKSGLVESQKVLGGIAEIKFVKFGEDDVVRHKIVRKIIGAYEKWQHPVVSKKS
ncbi:MAG: PhoH family protein [Endomicrobiia bacterium]|nr:PhoH family protein [Endomicrobiia bacterium]